MEYPQKMRAGSERSQEIYRIHREAMEGPQKPRRETKPATRTREIGDWRAAEGEAALDGDQQGWRSAMTSGAGTRGAGARWGPAGVGGWRSMEGLQRSEQQRGWGVLGSGGEGGGAGDAEGEDGELPDLAGNEVGVLGAVVQNENQVIRHSPRCTGASRRGRRGTVGEDPAWHGVGTVGGHHEHDHGLVVGSDRRRGDSPEWDREENAWMMMSLGRKPACGSSGSGGGGTVIGRHERSRHRETL